MGSEKIENSQSKIFEFTLYRKFGFLHYIKKFGFTLIHLKNSRSHLKIPNQTFSNLHCIENLDFYITSKKFRFTLINLKNSRSHLKIPNQNFSSLYCIKMIQ